MTKLSHLGEFNLIKLISGYTGAGKGVVQGIGDDAAVLEPTPGTRLLASCDMLVEGVHFLLEKISPYQLGYKALAVNISDVAAMGGIPRFALFSTGWSQKVSVEFVREFYAGAKMLADFYNVSIVGGDTVSSPKVVINVTILGEAGECKVASRFGAMPGNLIGVTGTLGDSAAGLAWLLQDKSGSPGEVAAHLAGAGRKIKGVVDRHLLPEPRVKAGQALLEMGATAMIDISDGLASELNHLCRESKVGGQVEMAAIPLSTGIKKLALQLNKDPLEWALYGGEDYELLVAFPGEKLPIMQKEFAGLGIPFTVIGKITEEANRVDIVNQDGTSIPLTSGGYNHFAGGREKKDD